MTDTDTDTDTLPAVVRTKSGKIVRVRVRKTGVNFGLVGQLVAGNGRVIATTDAVYPLGCAVAAHEGALALAARV